MKMVIDIPPIALSAIDVKTAPLDETICLEDPHLNGGIKRGKMVTAQIMGTIVKTSADRENVAAAKAINPRVKVTVKPAMDRTRTSSFNEGRWETSFR